MADTGPPWDLPYPLATDLVRDGAQAIQDLAEAVADGLNAAGGLVEVKTSVKTDTFTASVGSGAAAAITGLTIDHAVADASNRVVLYAVINGSSDQHAVRVNFGGALTAGGTALNRGDASGSRVQVASAASGSPNSNPQLTHDGLTLLAVHTPLSTGSVTYGVNVINVHNGTQTLYIGRSSADGNDTTNARSSCVLILAEVKV